ncbi:hypothetical protein [Burkholderia sp. NLJ2]|uniref:hypothetical protein n=1 Tax=Burkholderia sp. NLJ2 TaxID=3090699 RepID=UPI003C6CB9FC
MLEAGISTTGGLRLQVCSLASRGAGGTPLRIDGHSVAVASTFDEDVFTAFEQWDIEQKRLALKSIAAEFAATIVQRSPNANAGNFHVNRFRARQAHGRLHVLEDFDETDPDTRRRRMGDRRGVRCRSVLAGGLL